MTDAAEALSLLMRRPARAPADALAQYEAFLARAETAEDSRAIPVRPPVCLVNGERVAPETVLGDDIPPPVRLGRALQNRLQLVEHRDSLFDPLSGTFFEVRQRTDTVRFGCVKAPAEVVGRLFRREEQALVASTRSYQNFYHWMVETMPRTMRMAREFPGQKLLSHPHKLPFHAALHAFEGIHLPLEPLRDALFVEAATTTTIATNFNPNPRVGRHTVPAEEVLDFPRAVSAELQGKPTRVFISRRDANTRVLNDEAALIPKLEARGFTCPVMSELTLQEQAGLCANAEIIVSTHGAGLANMLFRADRPCKVVEIVPLRRWPHNNLICFYNLSQAAGFEHHVYDCGYPDETTRLLSQNWSVDHRQFLAFIDTLID